MGEVYLAEDTKLDRKVALKFLPLHLCPDADCRARFTREAQAAAKLDHPNIVSVFEVGEFQGRPFFAMQHVEGQTLKEVLTGKALPLDRILEIGIQVCDGLQAAHEKGITHRDIKPSNILIDSHGRARIVDFGLASVLGTDQLTKTGSTLGTIGYMSPEQVRGEKVDHRTDLFSLGVVLYELLTGHSPFKADSEAATLHAITSTKPELLARFRREIPSELQTIIDKALDKDVTTRYQHADELEADLRRLSSREAFGVGAAVPKGRWLKYAAIGAVLIVIAAVGYQVIWKNSIKERTGPDAGRKTVAVLPFVNLSGDPGQDYFSDGMSEELTTKLSGLRSLLVTSRSSTMSFKGSNLTATEIARKLKVRYIVEGSVRRSKDELRITAQLIDANRDAHLWARDYSGASDQVLDFQDSVANAIVAALEVRLLPEERRRFDIRSVNNPEAWELLAKAAHSGNISEARQGIQMVEKALNLTGDNAMAYCVMSNLYSFLVKEGVSQEESVKKADEYANKALEIDPDFPLAHRELAVISLWFRGDRLQAMEHIKHALVLSPDDPLIMEYAVLIYAGYLGQIRQADSLLERMKEVNPLRADFYTVVYGAINRFFAGDFDSASILSGLNHDSDTLEVQGTFVHALCRAYCGDTAEAFHLIAANNRHNPGESYTEYGNMLKCALTGLADSARAKLTPDLRRTASRDGQDSYIVACCLSRAGAKKEALDWLENAVNRGFINYPFLAEKDPFLDNIRGEERFKKLMVRVKDEWEHLDL